MNTSRYDIPPDWEKALQAIVGQPGTCLVIGPVDAGKSTFCLLAINRALEAGRRAALLDSDPGQSDVGPPACLGMEVFTKPVLQLGNTTAAALHFVGATSPAGHLLEVTVGTARLAQRAYAMDADFLVINTSGMIKGPGRALKAAKIRMLSPDHLISIASRGETEAILAGLRNRKKPMIHRLQPSSRAIVRGPDERRQRRESQFAAYFINAQEISLKLSDLAIQSSPWLSGEKLSGIPLSYAETSLEAEILWGERTPEGAFFIVAGSYNRQAEDTLAETFGSEIRILEKEKLENLLVGITDPDGEYIGMATIQAIDFNRKKLILRAPPLAPESIAGIKLGNLRVAPEGTELGSLPSQFWG